MTITAKQLSRLMGELGKRTSKKKAEASRENGKKGGRPRRDGSTGPQTKKKVFEHSIYK